MPDASVGHATITRMEFQTLPYSNEYAAWLTQYFTEEQIQDLGLVGEMVDFDGDKSVLKPSLNDVQNAINRAASHVLKSTKKVNLWFQKDIPEEEKEPFYNWIAKDKEIVKVILLLTGSI